MHFDWPQFLTVLAAVFAALKLHCILPPGNE